MMKKSFHTNVFNNQPLFKTTDPDQIAHYMSNAFRPNSSIVNGLADFCHHGVTLGSTSINEVRYGREAFVDVPPTDDVFLGMFTIAGFADVKQGKQTFTTRPGTFCVLNPTRHLQFNLSKDFKQLTVKLSSDIIKQVLIEATCIDLLRPPEFMLKNLPLNANNSSFAGLVQSICQDMSRSSHGFSHPLVSQHMEHALASLLLTEFPHNYSELLTTVKENPAPYYVKRAEEYMRENLCAPLTLPEIAVAAGTSVRSLQNGFKRFRHTTPTTFLRNQRLELAHQRLQKTVESNTPVTDIALACGFIHLSKFSQHYRNRFGESPTDTIKNNRSGISHQEVYLATKMR